MRNLLFGIVFLITTKVVLSGNPKENIEYVLDVIGDNNFERVDTDFSDPAVTVFTPVGDAEVGKVIYGDTTLWTRKRNQHFVKLLVFRNGHEHHFIHLFFKEGNKERALVIVRDNDKWRNTGKYDIKRSGKTGEELSPLSIISSKFSKLANAFRSFKSRKTGKDQDGNEDKNENQDAVVEELVESVDLEISGDPEEVANVKKFNSLGMPTLEYRPYFDKRIERVVDRFQTIWKLENRKKPLRQVVSFNKLGETRLLLVMTGTDFHDDSYYYEDIGDEWRSISRDQFYNKMRMRLFNAVDPEFDHPTRQMIRDLDSIVPKPKTKDSHSGSSSSGSGTDSGSESDSELDLPVPERVGSLSSLKSLFRKMKSPLARRRKRTYTYDKAPSDDEEEGGESIILYQRPKSESDASRRSSVDSSTSDQSYRIRYHIGDKHSPVTNTISIKRDPENEHSYKITNIEPTSPTYSINSNDSGPYSRRLPYSRRSSRGSGSRSSTPTDSIYSINSEGSGPYSLNLPVFDSEVTEKSPIKEEDFTLISSPVQESGEGSLTSVSSSSSTGTSSDTSTSSTSDSTTSTSSTSSASFSSGPETSDTSDSFQSSSSSSSSSTSGRSSFENELGPLQDELLRPSGSAQSESLEGTKLIGPLFGKSEPEQTETGKQLGKEDSEEQGKQTKSGLGDLGTRESRLENLEKLLLEKLEQEKQEPEKLVPKRPPPPVPHGKQRRPKSLTDSRPSESGRSGELGPEKSESMEMMPFGMPLTKPMPKARSKSTPTISHWDESIPELKSTGQEDEERELGLGLMGEEAKPTSSGSLPEEDEFYSHPDMPKPFSSGEYISVPEPRSESSTTSTSTRPRSSSGSGSGTGSSSTSSSSSSSDSSSESDSSPSSRSFSKSYNNLFTGGDSSTASEQTEQIGQIGQIGREDSGAAGPSEYSQGRPRSSQSHSPRRGNLPSVSTDDRPIRSGTSSESGTDSSSTSDDFSDSISSRPESIFHMTDLDTPSDENEGARGYGE